MVINHNMSAMFAQRSTGLTELGNTKNMEKLSSGMKINRAGDDASGLAVSEKMRAQIRGMNKDSENAQNAISFIQTTEGYLQETTDIVQRIRELAVQSSNGIYTDEDRMQIQVEVSALIAEVDRIASQAQFNGMNLLTGRFARSTGENSVTASMWFHVGANMDQRVQAFIGTMTAGALGLRNVGNEEIMTLATPDEANRAIGTLDEALKKINKQRADLGAYQNRLEKTVVGLDIGAENLQASESRIRELAVQSSNGIYSSEDRMQIQVEVSSLIAEVDRIASCAQFNGMNMLTGRFARPTGENEVTGSMWFHIGANMDQRTQVYIGTMSAMALGLRNVGDETIMTLETPDEANRAIGTLDEALKKINKQRADLGAYQNRLEKTVTGLDIGAENLQASESRIRDTDMAATMVDFTRDQVLSQAGTAMLAQANQSSQNVLSLLR